MITFEQAKIYNDRCLWDDDIVPFRSQLIALDGPTLEVALKEASRLVGSPKLIILPWEMADTLIRYEREKFNSRGGHYTSFDAYHEAHAKDIFEQSDLVHRTWGYLGTYLGADLLASGLTDYAWITNETEPKRINGNSTVFLTIARKNQ